MQHLAFDLGGSGGKMFSGELKDGKLCLTELHRFDNAPASMADALYWDIFKIFEELKKGLAKGAKDEDCTLGIDSFCNDFALIDKNGDMLCPVRCYRDARSIKYEKEIYSLMSKEELYKKTGNQIAPFNALMHLAAMKFAGQGYLLDNAHKLLFVPDLLTKFLTGTEKCEYTLMSVSQAYSYDKKDLDEDILKAFGLKKELFAQIAQDGDSAGRVKKEIKEELNIKDTEVVHVCGHDTGSAFLGSTEDDAIIISSGTWSIVGVENDTHTITDFGFENNFANEGGYPGHHRILHNVMGSWILQEVKRSFELKGEKYSHAEMAQEARKAEPFRYLIDVDDNLFYLPGNMPEKIKEKCMEKFGSAPETIGEITRCVMESLAMKYKLFAEKLETLTGKKRSCVNIIGGGGKNELLNEMTANAIGKRTVAGPSEATAIGNILVQMIYSGDIKDIKEGREIVKRSFEFKEYLPQDTENWEKHFERFKKIYDL